jgi:tRNA (mo5U34)-methyltransferase
MERTMAKADFGPFNYVRYWHGLFEEKSGWWHSFELPNGRVIDGVNTLEGLRNRLAQFPIPENLTGKRVLDIGAWDGWFSFEMERRGARVVAVDNWDNPRFREVHQLLASKVEYLQLDMYELTPERIGQFDIVLFLGVLYHLKHPLLALERVCALTTDLAAVDSFVIQERHRPNSDVGRRPIMEFYETNEFGGQTDNWVGPSVPCLMAFCRTAGFAQVELRKILHDGACVACCRKWPPPQPGKSRDVPTLIDAFHHTNFGVNFYSHLDDYINCWFDWPGTDLSVDDVKPEVGPYGVRPIQVNRAEGHWQATFKLPPGLAAGWHDARVRVGDSAVSNARTIAVDIPPRVESLTIYSLADGHSWEPSQIDLNFGNSLSLWIAGLPENADRANVRVYVAGKRLPVTYVEAVQGTGSRQVNVTLPDVTAENVVMPATVAIGAIESGAVDLRVIGRKP